MTEADFPEFASMLDAVCSLLSRGAYKPNPTNTALFFRAMAKQSLADVRAAFDAHVADPQRGRFVPVPADLLAQLNAVAQDDGRPGPEEAWAIAVLAGDELDTVVWTDEMAQAYGVAMPLQQAGDGVGARMAFKEAYGRLVDEARAEFRPVHWTPSLGHDPTLRDSAIAKAVALGRLPALAYPLLPAPLRGDALAAFSLAPEPVQAALQRVKLSLVATEPARSAAAVERERTDALKEEMAAAVKAYEEAQQ